MCWLRRRAARDMVYCCCLPAFEVGYHAMEAKETSPLVRAFARARKDVVERMSGIDFAPMTPEEADAKWQRAEQEVLLETNRAHDWRHRHSPWFRLYYHFF
jgi:hypothetical protein